MAPVRNRNRSGQVPERSRVNRSRSGPVRFGTVPVQSRVNIALFALTGSLAYFSFRVSAGMGLQSETKIEPDRRLQTLIHCESRCLSVYCLFSTFLRVYLIFSST